MRWDVPRNEDDNDEDDDDDTAAKGYEHESTWIYRAISSIIDFSEWTEHQREISCS